MILAHKCVDNYSFKEYVVRVRTSNCLRIAIQNYHKEIIRKQLFFYLGKTFLNRIVAQFGNEINITGW